MTTYDDEVLGLRQYRPVSTRQCTTDAAMGVDVAREMAASVNNAKYHACRHMLFTLAFSPPVSSTAADDTLIIPPLAPVFIPDGFNCVACTFRAETNSADSYISMWVDEKLYRSTALHDPSGFSSRTLPLGTFLDVGISHYYMDSTGTKTNAGFYLEIPRDRNGMSWAIVEAQTSGWIKLYSMSCWADRF